jgi:peptidoglycan/xylan/chitin deacetylase (PgdA/CDA1 family)
MSLQGTVADDKGQARRLFEMAGGAAATGALLHYLPSTAILATWLPVPPVTLGRGWCRWRGPAGKHDLAITFDDGPSALNTPKTLDLLDELGMKATFFLIGELANARPDLLAEIRSRGHSVGAHGQRHEHHLWRSPQWIRHDTAQSVESLRDATGERPRWYRPPYGQLTARTILEARRNGMELVLWTRWGYEFKDHDTASVLARLETGMMPGAVLLLHDSDVECEPGTAARTHRLLPHLAEAIAERGLRTVTLDEMLEGAATGDER